MKSLSVKLGVILIGLAIFGCAEVWGANWKFLGGSIDRKYEFYYDTQSVVRYGTIVRVWQKDLDTRKDFPKIPQGFTNETLFLMEIDCASRTYRVLKMVFLFQDGGMREVPSVEIPLEKVDVGLRDAFNKQFIIPQTPQEVLYKSVCK